MPYSLPPLLTSRTQAVNSLLQSIGEPPVDQVETSDSVEVVSADAAITEWTNTVLMKGWHFNTEYDYEIASNGDNEKPLPSNYLQLAYAYANNDLTTPVAVTARAGKLYDTENHTFIFEAGRVIKVDMLLALEWEEMSEAARKVITAEACKTFQARLQGSRIVAAIEEDTVLRCWANLEMEEDRANPANQIRGNRETLYRLYGRLLRRRS